MPYGLATARDDTPLPNDYGLVSKQAPVKIWTCSFSGVHASNLVTPDKGVYAPDGSYRFTTANEENGAIKVEFY